MVSYSVFKEFMHGISKERAKLISVLWDKSKVSLDKYIMVIYLSLGK